MRILIADDDKAVRDSLIDYFTAEGHEVVACRDGVEALHEYRKSEREFDAVITDYQMPRMNGIVLIINLRGLDPKVPVVLISGDPPRLGKETKELTGEFPMLAKPYRPSALLALVESVAGKTETEETVEDAK